MRLAIPMILALALVAGPAQAQRLMNDTFGNNNNGWTFEGAWERGTAVAGGGACGNNLGFMDPENDARNQNSGSIAGTNIGGNLPPTSGWEYLTSKVFPTCPGETVRFAYGRWLNVGPQVDASVEVFDGSSWIALDTYTGHYEDSWSRVVHDVSAFANPQLRFRFGVQTRGGYAGTCSGFNVDNVHVRILGVFFDDFDDTTLGWTLNGNWEIGPAMSGGGGDRAFDGDRFFAGGIAGNVIGGNTGSMGVIRRLVSPAFDTTGLVQPTLTFDRKLGMTVVGASTGASIDVFDGSSWQEIWEASGTVFDDSAYTERVYDITQYSNAGLRVRFNYQSNGFAPGNDYGWNLDNVSVHEGLRDRGQLPAPGVAILDINGALSCITGNAPTSGDAGPYATTVSVSNDTLTFAFEGAPDQAIVLMNGDVGYGANPIAPFGTIDLGVAGFAGFSIIASGLDAGFLNNLFNLTSTGTQSVTFLVPGVFAGVSTAFQAIITNPLLAIQTTNAVEVAFLP